jgi:hypothetical protein
VLALVPSARTSAMFGATLPFWLVIAPLLDLAWVGRARWMRVLQAWRRKRRAARQPRDPMRLRSMRRRNSSMMRRYRSSPR